MLYTRLSPSNSVEISHIKTIKNCYSIDVTGHGSSFHIIFGKSNKGNYLCIPEWNVGCELASFSDSFWNQERLEQQLSKTDAITIAIAIKEASQFISKNELYLVE